MKHYLFINVNFAIIWLIKASSKHLGPCAWRYFWSMFWRNQCDWQFQNTGHRVNIRSSWTFLRHDLKARRETISWTCPLPYRYVGASTHHEWFWQRCCWCERRKWAWWGTSVWSPDQTSQLSPFEFGHGHHWFKMEHIKFLYIVDLSFWYFYPFIPIIGITKPEIFKTS